MGLNGENITERNQFGFQTNQDTLFGILSQLYYDCARVPK